jgi:hypothetical protein
MWPFSKPATSSQPAEVSRDGLTARYDSRIQRWVFQCQGIPFWLSDPSFNEQAFAWAGEAVPVIKNLEDPIRKKVAECLEGWECDLKSAELLCVSLDDYDENQILELEYVGNDSWGDMGVTVIITRGKITDVHGGD